MGRELKEALLKKPTGKKNDELVNLGYKLNINKPDDLAETLKKYRKATINLPKVYENYMLEITGADNLEDAERIATQKMNEVKEILTGDKDGIKLKGKLLENLKKKVDSKTTIGDAAEKYFNFVVENVINAHNNIKDHFDNSTIKGVNQGSLISSEFFRLNVGYLADRTSLLGDLDNREDLDEPTQKAVLATLKAYAPNAEEMGFNQNTIEYLDYQTELIYNIDRRFKQMLITDYSAPEIKKVYEEGTAINEKILGYIKSGDESLIPTNEEFHKFADAIISAYYTRPVFDERMQTRPTFDAIKSNMFEMLEDLCEMCPDVKGKFEELKKDYNKVRRESYYDLKKRIATLDRENDKQKIKDSFKEIDLLYAKGIVTREELDKARMLGMLRVGSMQEEIEEMSKEVIHDYAENLNKGPEDILANRHDIRMAKIESDERRDPKEAYQDIYTIHATSKYVEALKDQVRDLLNHPGDSTYMLKHGMDADLYNTIGGMPIPEDKISQIEDFLYESVNTTAINELGEKKPNVVAELIDSDSFMPYVEEMAAEVKASKYDIVSNLPDKTIDVFTKKGSDLYCAITQKLYNSRKGLTRPGDNKQEQLDLYDALKNYVNNRDSRPFHDYGKERFNNAANLMGQLSDTITKIAPDRAAEVQKDMQILMLRNKQFRDKYLESLRAQVNELGGKNGKISKEKIDSLSPELQNKAKVLKGMITFGEYGGQLLERTTKYGQITGKMYEKNQDKVLEEYSAKIKDEIKKTLNDKQKTKVDDQPTNDVQEIKFNAL